MAMAQSVARFAPLTPPTVSARSIYVVDFTSGTELLALNPDEPLPPASLTKIVSALVVLDKANLDDIITIEESDLVSPEESQVGLQAGDELSGRDLLRGMLIPSGNDATRAMARTIGRHVVDEGASNEDAIAAFVDMMNVKAREVGALASHFVTPTGMDAPGHVMSARDVATVTAVAMKNPLFAEIVAMPTAVLASKLRPEGYTVSTTNTLLLEGVATGVKTGTTPEAGGCLVTSYNVGPNQVLAVVLGSDVAEDAEGVQDSSARYDDTRLLMATIDEDFVWVDPSNPAAPGPLTGLREELQVWGVNVESSAFVPVPTGRDSDVSYRLVLDEDEANEISGEVRFYLDDAVLSELTAVATG
jgi:D-alanyl-D-alanine carboxypeptidase (penicillin-binding protein 5/6)